MQLKILGLYIYNGTNYNVLLCISRYTYAYTIIHIDTRQ